MMAKTEVTSAQVQLAAQAGVELLKNEELPVPLKMAKSGILGVLEGLLQALASGEVMLMQLPPEMMQAQSADTPAENKEGNGSAIAPVESGEGDEIPSTAEPAVEEEEQDGKQG